MASRPKRLFRIADIRHPIWSGKGAELHGGRWNAPGRAVIYASETYSGARLELLVRLPLGRVPATLRLVRCDLQSTASFEVFDPQTIPDWRENRTATQAFGNKWLDEGRSLLLLVPSIAADGEHNVLVSEAHPQFRSLRPSNPEPIVWDARLFERR
jgi:RES domain-containing protein